MATGRRPCREVVAVPKSLACPNPNCDHEFPAAAAAGLAALVCPKCGGVFQRSVAPAHAAKPEATLLSPTRRVPMIGLLAATALALGIGSLIVAGCVIQSRRPQASSAPEA